MLVVDDSVLMGTQIAKILSSDSGIEVVGRAKDGVEAVEMVARLKPDVVTLDVEMPVMDGITALKHIMVRNPVPTIMLSALTKEGTKVAFDALRYGALDVIAKPSRRETDSLDTQKEDIITRVKQAAVIGVHRSRYKRSPALASMMPSHRSGSTDATTRVIGIGSGTGAYYALLQVIPNLGKRFDHVLLALVAIGPRFIEPFVAYLAAHSAVAVRSMRESRSLVKGTCYVGSWEEGAIVGQRDDGTLVLRSGIGERPGEGRIDRLFRSIAVACRSRAVGVIMSGAGADGAEGTVMIRKRGGLGIIQAVGNCMNPSMPRAVLARGPVDRMLPDFLLAGFLMNIEAESKGTGNAPRTATQSLG